MASSITTLRPCPRLRVPSFALALALVLPVLGSGAVARADGATHEIRKTEPKVAVGGAGKASLTIAAKNGWHVNAEAPITVSLTTSDAGLTVAKSKLVRADLVESTKDAARFDIAFSTAADAPAGKKTINAEAKFVMCQESACKPVKETLALNVEITSPAPMGAGAATPGHGKTKGQASKLK